MDSNDRFWAIFWVAGFAFLTSIVLCFYAYGIQSMPITMQRQQQDHQLKMTCIAKGGNWGSTDNDNHPPYSCKIR
ncbi:MAG: hypothetical protein EOO61_01415 [Hymenobacter sp.]|nr:MAG: hypothetical protein EOO61_01415 [Hymenobacter sp.]